MAAFELSQALVNVGSPLVGVEERLVEPSKYVSERATVTSEEFFISTTPGKFRNIGAVE